jgi:microcystin degradation protein MlrC
MYHMLFGTRHHSDQLHYRTSRTLNLRESQIVVRECEEELRHTAITKATAKADPAGVVLDSAAGFIRRDLRRHTA